METSKIQEIICREEVLKGNIPCENVSNLFYNSELDVCSILKSGYVSEYEVKVSRSDFKADAKKEKWKWFDWRDEHKIPNYFYYACPPDLISKNEIQDYAGLIYVHENHIEVVKKAKILHRRNYDLIKIMSKFLRVKSQRKYLGACLLTYKNNLIKQRTL